MVERRHRNSQRGRFPTTDNPSLREIISFIIGSDDSAFMLPSGWEVPTAVLLAFISFPLSLLLARFFIQANARSGIFGIDVHQLSKPRTPPLCAPVTSSTLSP